MSSRFRFRFTLNPLNDVMPWSSERLHWFGLTEGRFWIEFYDEVSLKASSTSSHGREGRRPIQAGHYVDYYVGRYWEDLIQLTSAVVQPVPSGLVEFITSYPESWAPVVGSDEAWEAAVWHGEHVLDLSYLRQPPHIRAWRAVTDGVDGVTLSWRHPADSEIKLIAKSDGCVHMATDSFVDAVRQLDAEFMNAMRERIIELEMVGVRDLMVGFDMDELRREQLSRATWFAQRLDIMPSTNWEAVSAGARQLLGH